MTPDEIKALVAARLQVAHGFFDDEQVIALFNHYLALFRNRILMKNDRMFLRTMTLDLVSGQREYELKASATSPSIFRIRKVVANLKKNTTDPNNYVVLKPLDFSVDIADDDEDKIRQVFSNVTGGAYYEQRGEKIFLYTDEFVSVTGGLKIEYYTKFKTITVNNLGEDLSKGDTTGIGVPDELHPILADAISFGLKTSSDKVIPVLPEEENWEARLEEVLIRAFPETRSRKPKFRVKSVFVDKIRRYIQ